MFTTVALVGPSGREVEALLRSGGRHVTVLEPGRLAELANPSGDHFDVVVIDLRGTMALPPAIGAIRRHRAAIGIIILTSALDPALLVEAMRAGVNEVVTDPINETDLERAIARVGEQQPAADVGEVFGFIGAKGGVGTTTVAVNTAAVLGTISKPARALLIDLHLAGGDAAVFLGTEPRFSFADALENTHRLDHTFLRSLVTEVAPGVDLLPSSEREVSGAIEPSTIRRVIEVAATAYKYIVIDLPRSDVNVLDALDPLQRIVVVANQELATVKSARRLAARLGHRYGRDKVSIVLSRMDRQAEIGHADVEHAVGSQVAHAFPSDYRVALQALNRGRPIALENHSELSGSFKRFAQQLAGTRPDRAPVQRVGLLGRLIPQRA